VGDELGGHILSGHVDGIGEVTDVRPEGDSHRLTIRAPEGLARFIAEKGSIAVDGISLTVNEVEGPSFGVNIIPHTWEVTSLSGAAAGTRVNLEIDLLARYVARLHDVAG
jgi:riboflavin synthase